MADLFFQMEAVNKDIGKLINLQKGLNDSMKKVKYDLQDQINQLVKETTEFQTKFLERDWSSVGKVMDFGKEFECFQKKIREEVEAQKAHN